MTWPTVRLRDVVQIQLGKMMSPAAKLGRRPIPYLRNANVQWNRFALDDVADMDFDEVEEAKFRLVPGDVLVCEGGEPGRAALWRGEIERCCYQKAIHRLRPINGRIDPQFLVFRLWYGASRGEFTDDHAKTTIAHLPAVRLAELEIRLPAISEQRRIAARLAGQLATVEAARSSALQLARRIADLRAQVLDHSYEAARQRSSTAQIGSVARIQTGYAFKSEWFRASGERLLRNVNIRHGSINWEDAANLDPGMVGQFDAFRLRAGDVVLSLDRPLVGSGIKVARVDPADLPALLLQRVARFITSPTLDAAFLYFFLLSGAFVDAIGGHDQSLGVPHVSPRQVGAVPIPLPSVGEQRRIAGSLHERLATIDAMTAAVDAQLAAIQALRSALLRDVFDGASA